MAILREQLSLSAIQALRGIVDVYCWKGKIVARAWPHWTKHKTSIKWTATWDALRAMFAWRKANPISWHHQWEATSIPKGNTYEDAKRKTGLLIAYAGVLTQAPDITNITQIPHVNPPETRIKIYCQLYPGFYPDSIAFRVRTYTGAKTPLAWTRELSKLDRRGHPEYKYRPDVHPYKLPNSCSWFAPTSHYLVKIPITFDKTAVYPTPLIPIGNDLMAGPPYYAEDF